MNMQMCRNGHFFNMDENAECPYCEKETGKKNLMKEGIAADFPSIGRYLKPSEQKIKSRTYAYTNSGGRSCNQDCLWYKEKQDCEIWVMADGLGGHRQSERASEVIIRTVQRLWEENRIPEYTELFLQCHNEIRNMKKEYPEAEPAASTMLVVQRKDDLFSFAHTGDSRLYFFRNNKLLFRTKDHSVAQISVSLGEMEEEELYTSKDRNKLYHVIGGKSEPKAEVGAVFALSAGDAFLLCTDGFWEHISEAEIINDLVQASTAQEWAENMLNRISGRLPKESDNYSLMCVFVL